MALALNFATEAGCPTMNPIPTPDPARPSPRGPGPVVRRGLLAGATLFLLLLAWAALSGGMRQLPRSLTLWQRVETWVQLALGLLSLLVVATSFRWRRGVEAVRAAWTEPVRAAWAAALVITAGLSSLVWGPPMPLIAALFAALTLLLAVGVIRALRVAAPPKPGGGDPEPAGGPEEPAGGPDEPRSVPGGGAR